MLKAGAEGWDLPQVQVATLDCGEAWLGPHVRRVLWLAGEIAGELRYDAELLAWAAHLHDWGALARYRLPGSDHALRSRQIAENEILPSSPLDALQRAVVLEAIARHDYRHPHPPDASEALLLREADALDLLGAIGIAREFAWGPNDLAACLRRICARRDDIPPMLKLPLAQALAAKRVAEMDDFLVRLVAESAGSL